jgi:hypothetical protein
MGRRSNVRRPLSGGAAVIRHADGLRPDTQQPPRPQPTPVVLIMHADGYVEILAPRGAVRVGTLNVPRVYHDRNERLARELAYLRAPAWVRRFLNSLESRTVATASVRECLDALELADQQLTLDLIAELEADGPGGARP